MHINSHFAIGMIIASISNFFIRLNLLEFILIVLCAFISDFDVFFTKLAKDNNHRNLFSHSIYPGIIILIISLIFTWPALLIASFSFISHIMIDFLDWGTNVFYFPKKPYGIKYLISKEEEENLVVLLKDYKINASYFDFKYYSHKPSLFIETILFILMLIIVIFFALEYILLTPFYFLGLYFHLSRHFYLKKVEHNQKSKEK